MRPTCLAKAVLQNLVRSLQKENVDAKSGAVQGCQLLFKVDEKGSLTNINDQRRTLDAFLIFAGRDQPSKHLQHRDWQIVHTEISEILESVSG